MLQVDFDGGDGQREVELGERLRVQDADPADGDAEGDDLGAPPGEEGVVLDALQAVLILTN